MTQISYFWTEDATFIPGDDTNPITDDQFSDFFSILNLHDRRTQGVLYTEHPSYSSLLAVSSTGGANVRVANGAAFVDGKMYYNTANVDNNVSGNAVYWIIGLQKSWAAQTVRVFARGNYASRALALASLDYTDSTTWEIPLATVLTDAGGNVSAITDERTFVYNMGGMYKIADYTVTPSVGDITFSNIKNCFSSLYVCAYLKTDSANNFFDVRFNNDLGNTYYYQLMSSFSSTDDVVDETTLSAGTNFLGRVTGASVLDGWGVVNIYITNYVSPTYYASILMQWGGIDNTTAPTQGMSNGIYRTSGPITRIDIDGRFSVGSRATLFGMA